MYKDISEMLKILNIEISQVIQHEEDSLYIAIAGDTSRY